MKHKELIFFALFLPQILFSQQFLWDIDFRFQFDNREYKSLLTHSGTLFGAKLAPEIGIGWDNAKKGTNALMLGIDVTADFGAKMFNTIPELLLYYNYRSPRFNVYAGLLPRNRMIGDYSNAFFNDSIRFYDATIEGLLLHYKDPWGYVEFGCDWNSMYSKENREKFMLFSAGKFLYKWFNMGYAFQMYHFAGSYTEKGVIDNLLFSPYVGFNVSSITPLDTLYIKIAYLQGYQWDRPQGVSARKYPKGGQIDFGIEKWGVGIYDAFYFGENQMPYFEEHGHKLYWGEDYYRTSKLYNRLEVYWHPLKSADLDLKIKSVHHFEGKHWGWQQVVCLGVNVNNGMFQSFKNSKKWWKKEKDATQKQ